MDRALRMTLLYDFYGALLTAKQQEIFQLYFQEDLSLGEISEQAGVSRQAVHDMLSRATDTLEQLETKMQLVERFVQEQRILEMVVQNVSELREAMETRGKQQDVQALSRIEQLVRGLVSMLER